MIELRSNERANQGLASMALIRNPRTAAFVLSRYAGGETGAR